jgi:uncharacterized protein YndB with AHSA1/START domain
MSKLQEISARATSSAPPEAVWRLLADVNTWSEWADFDHAEVERPADDGGQGPGAVRRFRLGRRTTRERVIAADEPTRFSYELISGLPIRDYNADVTLIPRGDGGTEIHWDSRFHGRFPVPGGLMRHALGRFVQATATNLARAAEREHADGGSSDPGS